MLSIFKRRQLTDKESSDIAGGLQRSGDHARAVDLFRQVYERDTSSRLHLGQYARALRLAGRMDKLRALAATVDLHIYDECRVAFTHLHDLTAFERAVYLEMCLEACQTPEAVAQLCRSVRYVVQNNIPGDFAECGVFRGASIVAMIRTLQDLGVERRIWLYDTFEGMPKPEAVDKFHTNLFGEDWSVGYWEKTKRPDGGCDWMRSTIDQTREYIAVTGYPEPMLRFVKGMVENTIPGDAPERLSLLRLDTDFYSSTRHELEHFYPRLERGGVLILDDYGAYQGAQKAADEYFSRVPFHMSRIDEHVRVGVKV